MMNFSVRQKSRSKISQSVEFTKMMPVYIHQLSKWCRFTYINFRNDVMILTKTTISPWTRGKQGVWIFVRGVWIFDFHKNQWKSSVSQFIMDVENWAARYPLLLKKRGEGCERASLPQHRHKIRTQVCFMVRFRAHMAFWKWFDYGCSHFRRRFLEKWLEAKSLISIDTRHNWLLEKKPIEAQKESSSCIQVLVQVHTTTSSYRYRYSKYA